MSTPTLPNFELGPARCGGRADTAHHRAVRLGLLAPVAHRVGVGVRVGFRGVVRVGVRVTVVVGIGVRVRGEGWG